MIRFPNPGSDIPTFIRIFQVLYTYLEESRVFTLDDMSRTLTKMNLATSSGFVGEEALSRSTRRDRSLDPLYNQSKMYAELFRSLGWIASMDKALLFSFTYLGAHVAAAKVDPKLIFEESVFGMSYPNQNIKTKNEDASRTFAAMLLIAKQTGGYTCRDEIILGAQNIDDTKPEAIDNAVRFVMSLRGNSNRLQSEIEKLSARLGISITTMQNYTRFVLSALTYCGWFVKEPKANCYKGRGVMLRLTDYGRSRIELLKNSLDVRLTFFESIKDKNKQSALIRLGFYSMLGRASFDIYSVAELIGKDKATITDILNGREILFSPYQLIRRETVDAALGIESVSIRGALSERLEIDESADKGKTTKSKKIIASAESTFAVSGKICNKIRQLIKTGKTDEEIVGILFAGYKSAKKEVFYNCVADLFSSLGFDCKATRHGVNYERWDAMISDAEKSVPIEIKSPTEEWMISIKAVRQALENKVVLLSRKSYKTDWETVSLAVGYNPPNTRAEVEGLVGDIKKTYGIRIGVVDFFSLVRFATVALRNGKSSIDINKWEGIINA